MYFYFIINHLYTFEIMLKHIILPSIFSITKLKLVQIIFLRNSTASLYRRQEIFSKLFFLKELMYYELW